MTKIGKPSRITIVLEGLNKLIGVVIKVKILWDLFP
jgi:hypothetical protein